MKRLQLLFLNHNVAWQGSFFRGFHWGRHLVRRGHRVTLLTISEDRRQGFEIQERDGVQIVKTPDLCQGRLRSGWDPWDTLNRLRYLWPQKYDLVHSVDSRPVCILPAIMSKKLKNTKLVIDWLDWWGRGGTISERSTSLAERLFAPVETFFEEGFRHLADGSVVISSALKKRALALGVGADHLIRLPFGADTENLTPRHKNEARRRLGLAADQPLLGYLGNISFVNDRNLLLESFRLLGERNRNIHLILIGRSGIQDSDIDPDLRPNIVKTGALSYEALQDYIAACDLMLLPLKNSIANRGRWPSKIGDYLAAGRPVVSCKVGDIAELFANQPIGLLTNDNPYDFAAGVLELLESRDINDMGRNARNVAETSLAWNILTDRLESFYYKILYQN